MAEKRINIVMLGQKHMLSREGGVEIVVKELATRLVARGHNVTVYDRSTNHISGEDIKRVNEYKGVIIKEVWTMDKKGLAALTSSFFAAIKAARSKAEIVHIHAEGPAAMCFIPKLCGKKVVVTVHGLDWKRAKWGGVASKYMKFGERQAVRWADEIIVLSRGIQDYFMSTYKRTTVLIPNGVNKHEKRKAELIRDRWELKKDSYILFLGRIVPEKGLSYLVEAWKTIDTEKKLVIAGGASDTEDYLKELKRSSSDDIIYVGFQQGRVLEELYSNAYVYCLPSDLEGMPLSLLEAMSYGNCCLVSDISECTEVIEDKGVVFHHSDIENLRTILQELLDNPDTVKKYKDGASNFICQKYNWDTVVDMTLRAYIR